MRLAPSILIVMLLATSEASATEVCGNSIDDDSNLLVDEGCYSGLVTQCENPLSCQDTGYVAPRTGSLHYSLPADVAPKSPWGVPLAFARYYVSQYEPGAGAPAYRKALGPHWGHSYATWLDRNTTPNPDQVVVHLPRGQDVMFQYVTTAGGWEEFKSIQPGYHFQWLKRRTTSPNEFQLRTLTGETMVYNSGGRLTEIWDSLATPNKTLLSYSGGHVTAVTDATTKRRLLFVYSGGLMTTVRFQINTGSWVTQHTTTYGYTSGNLTSVTIGGQSAQANTYAASNDLTSIQDGNGNTLVSFVYDGATAGKIVRVDTPRGVVGWEFASSRANCSGQTVLYFHRANTTTCNTDTDCGSGNLCGGKTGAGTTGQCFRGARCLTVASPSEDVITTVSAFAGVGGGTSACDGACLDAIDHVWDTTGGKLDLLAEKSPADPSSYYEVKEYDDNGMPLKIMYGATAANGTGAQRTLFLTYDTSFPGKVATTRRQSELDGDVCTSGSGSCATTANTYTTDGKLATVTETGLTKTVASYPGSTGYTHTTSYDYDAKGRLIEIDGPLSGSTDLTTFEFWSAPSDPVKDGFLQSFKRQKDGSNILTQSSLTFDFWGNATSIGDVDGTISCQSFDAARGYLTQRREQMAGQTDCTANAADLVTGYVRDTALRLTKLTRPDGSCLIYEYDTRGRLSKTKRRDDCNPASGGDRQEYTYSDDGLLVKIETFDAGSTVTKRQELTYRDSRRLEKMINPVNTAKWTGITYTPRGLVANVTAFDGATELSKTVWSYDEEGRVASEKRYASTSVFDTWNLMFDWIGGQESVTDGDGKTTSSTRDDLGRVVVLGSPDLGGYPTLRVYDQANRLVTLRETVGGASMKEHLFTFDNLGRPLVADYAGSCQDAFGLLYPVPDIVRAYDTLPGGVTCPFGSGACDRAGRLVYVKVKLMCLPAVIGGGGPDADFTLEQETFYQYDAAGRVIREFIQDDVAAPPNNRTADHQYAWTKNGALAQTTLPSGAVHGSTFGSAGSNSDADRVTALWRTTIATPIIDNILYEPYGPFRQYNQMNSASGSALRTKVLHNLAYRVTETRVETQSTSATQQSVTITEDYKGRVTGRNYTPNISGLVDSYFVYDGQDRLLCERPTAGTTCPTSYGGEKNNHYSSAGATKFTAAGDWKSLWRPIVGSTGWTHTFSLVSGTHQIYEVNQSNGTPTYGITRFTYDSRGNRSSDDNITTASNDQRTYTYDSRRNVIAVQGKYFTYQGPNCGSHGQPLCWAISDYTVTSAFDALNRRVFKSYKAGASTATWFFYYDPLRRLSEIRYTPNAADPSTYTVYELVWLGDQLVAYWQTNYPSVTTWKSYLGRDESGRPIDMLGWPASGDASRWWAINPDAWGNDTALVPGFQPIVFAGQYQDQETVAYSGTSTSSSPTRRRPALVLNGYRTYDPWTGSYLQVDPLQEETWDTYVYVDSNPIGNIDPLGLAYCPGNEGGIGCSGPIDSFGEGEGRGGGGGCGPVCEVLCEVGLAPGCNCFACNSTPTLGETGCNFPCQLKTQSGLPCLSDHEAGCYCSCDGPEPPDPPEVDDDPPPPGPHAGNFTFIPGPNYICKLTNLLSTAAAVTTSVALCIQKVKDGKAACGLASSVGVIVVGGIFNQLCE